jgi:hypothetical protein
METSITKKEENAALLSQVVDAKLTRTELLDLIVERVSAELGAESDRLKAERMGLETSLSLTAALDLLKYRVGSTDIELEDESSYNYALEQRVVTGKKLKIKVHLPREVELPKRYVDAHARLKTLNAAIGEVERKRSRLINGKARARNEMVKHALESTPEGAKILEAISALKESIKEKLLTVGGM